MPNMKGGKKYKSGKHADEKSELHEIHTDQGQSIGRVLKHLGDRNVLLYCNDNIERIAHIRGGLSKKKATIDKGDIVLYSNRGDGLGSDKTNLRADIIAKFNHDTHRELKKQEGVNPKLFLQIERIDGQNQVVEDDGVDFEADSDDYLSEDEKEARKLKRKEEDQLRSAARDTKTKVGNDDDLDIDAI
jgi:translation initiation factor 1A